MTVTVERLERWELFGASWEVVEVSDREVVVDFCSCTGELVERRRSGDPVVIEYVRRARPALSR
jgi:hypothetical protein